MNSGSENEPYHTNTDGHHSPTVEGAQPTVVPAQHSSATFTGATSPSMSGDTISSGARVHFADESPNTNDGAPTVSSTQRPKVTVPSSATNNPAHKKDNPLNTREMTSPVQSWQASFDSDASAMGRVVTPEDQYSAVYPSKTRSVLITKNKGTYKAVADSLDEPQVTNVSFLVPGLASSEGKVETPQLSNGSFLLPENEQRDIDHNDALHAYEFIVDDADNVESSSSEEEEPSQTQSKDSHHEPFASRENSSQITNTSRVLATEEAAEIMEQLSRSFALQRHAPKQASAGHFPFGTSDKNSFAAEGEYSPGDDYYFDLPMPEVRACTSVCNLECESVSWVSIIQSGKSDALLKALFFGFRITLFCIFPSYVLVEHPNTKAYFVSGTLLPIMGALSVREPCSLGMQCLMTICGLQGILVFMIWGCVTNAVGTKYNTSAWWCALISGAFAANLLGDLLAKRLIMMFIVIVMQMQHMPGGETIGFPIRLARDILFAFFFALVAVILPYPTLCKNMARDAMIGVHKLHAAALGNVVKSFWAPVLVDAKIAYHQIPFVRIREVQGKIRKLLKLCRYEPSEFNLNNIHRGERLALLDLIKVDLYSMASCSSMRLEESGKFTEPTFRKELKDMKDLLQKASGALAKEIIGVFMTLGSFMAPNDVLNNIKFDAMCERAQVLSDLVDKKRAEIFFVQKLTKDETNYFLRVFAFCMGLVNIANKLRDFEQQCVNFDKSKYPSIWKRAFDFFFYEMWVDFWGELPKRMTWATNRDVRMWKDGIRYTLGFAVACAFTLNYDKENVYFFGMAILVRLAQQTASETIFIGVQRICGLAIGASLAVITQGKTHNLAEKTLLTMTWEFIAMSLANHPQFGQMAQYVAVITITGQALAITPSVLLTRITDNVFAFISYFLICVIIFPVDPIRMLWNTRTKLFIMTNQITQNMVTLISAPVTTSGESVKFLTKKNAADLKSMLGMLAVYEDWMTKSVGEPTIRGGVYPARAVSKVLTTLTEILALHEALHHSVEILHRPRTTAVQVMVRDVMELIRPFVLDVGKLYHSYLQELIDSTEFPVHWTMENSVRILWKAHIACRMLRHMTGNIQRNFYAAIQQVSGNERKNLNFYLNSSVIESALASGTLPPELLNPENEEMLERLFAMSFHMNDESVLLREDLHAFNIIVTVFQLELKMLEDLILPMIEIHEFEKSRVT